MDPGRKGTHIDHDHVTDEPRGLLCPNCNLLLGHAHDSAEILAKAISYLTRS
jgi:Recombination endonuclease VII